MRLTIGLFAAVENELCCAALAEREELSVIVQRNEATSYGSPPT